jgi:hypothetical protein
MPSTAATLPMVVLVPSACVSLWKMRVHSVYVDGCLMDQSEGARTRKDCEGSVSQFGSHVNDRVAPGGRSALLGQTADPTSTPVLSSISERPTLKYASVAPSLRTVTVKLTQPAPSSSHWAHPPLLVFSSCGSALIPLGMMCNKSVRSIRT